jgi:citrate lyase subunit beta/citryl-CoA lyase
MPPLRPRRSVLFVPGSNARALEKARSLPADSLILDLEDAVAPDAKAAARDAVITALRERAAFGAKELVLRVNGLDTAWGADDLAAAAGSGADGVLLSKVESTETIQLACRRLADAGASATLPVWVMIETPRGVLRAEEIADCPAVACLVMGTSDLTKELHARHTPQRLPLLAALGHCLLAARAAGRPILDGVHLDLEDEAAFAAACRQGRDLGFDGKTLIHPRQIAPANAAFGPDPAAIEEARKIIEAHDAARAAGQGVTVLGGRLVENLHVEEARRILELAAAIEGRRTS